MVQIYMILHVHSSRFNPVVSLGGLEVDHEIMCPTKKETTTQQQAEK